MNPPPSLTGGHLHAYQAIFQHPISHNLEWREIHSLMEKLGQVEHEHNGNSKVTRNGQTMILHSFRAKDVAEADEIMALRHFLSKSETPVAITTEDEGLRLLVISHREIRLFHSVLKGGIPQHILPHDPADFFRHAQDSKWDSRGKEKPDPHSYFEPVVKALHDASRILIFGTGTGMSSEMDQFISWLKEHHLELSRRIIGAVRVDESHLTENQLLEQAREFYRKIQAVSPI